MILQLQPSKQETNWECKHFSLSIDFGRIRIIESKYYWNKLLQLLSFDIGFTMWTATVREKDGRYVIVLWLLEKKREMESGKRFWKIEDFNGVH